MKLHCRICNISYSVSEDKIPQGVEVKALCPRCGNPIGLPDLLTGADRQTADVQAQPSGDARGGENAPIERNEVDEEAALVDIVEEGIRTALLFICDNETRSRLMSALGLMDFYVVTANSAPFALRKIQHNSYDVVFVDDVVKRGTDVINPLLRQLQLLAMPVRRRFFLCLISENLRTMDKMTAYRLGVNLVLNSRDLQKTKIILTRALKEYEGFYKLFQDEILRKGQL